MEIILFVLLFWVIGSIAVREYASGKMIGQNRALTLSLLLSPVIGFILTYMSDNKGMGKKSGGRKLEFICVKCGSVQNKMFKICPVCGNEADGRYTRSAETAV